MTARHFTHKDKEFSVTIREQLGRDIGTNRFVQITLREHLKKEMNVDKLPDVIWETILPVAAIITQTVSVEGDVPFRVPSPSDPEADIITFYECLMNLPGRYIRAFEKALSRIDADDIPNPDGEKTALS